MVKIIVLITSFAKHCRTFTYCGEHPSSGRGLYSFTDWSRGYTHIPHRFSFWCAVTDQRRIIISLLPGANHSLARFFFILDVVAFSSSPQSFRRLRCLIQTQLTILPSFPSEAVILSKGRTGILMPIFTISHGSACWLCRGCATHITRFTLPSGGSGTPSPP